MTALPSIPRLYTALAECLAVGIYALPLGIRFGKTATIAASAAWALALSAFLQATGSVPLAWWIPCMAAAVAMQYLYLWLTRTISLLEAGYVCARAFVLAELAASAEWQLHCFLWPQRSGADGLSLALLAVVYSGVFGCIWLLEHKHASPKGRIVISGKAALVAVVMAAMVFAVSNLLFLGDREVDMSVYYIRTLVDICGVLILTVQHEQLREAALHSELAAMDEVLHRQYEQYKRSKEGIRLINSRYHELKIQIADIRAERDRAKQDAALARMESGIRRYEAEILLLFVVGFLPQELNLLANSIVSFSCAMQVQAFRKVNGYAFASTMCIGNLRSGMDSLCAWLVGGNAKAFGKAVHYFAIIFLFALGAGIGSVALLPMAGRAIWLSCLLLGVSFCLMFLKEDIEELEQLEQMEAHKK